MGKIATEKEAYYIGKKGSVSDNNKCCTKTRANELGCKVSGSYKDNQLVQLSDLYTTTVYETFSIDNLYLVVDTGSRIRTGTIKITVGDIVVLNSDFTWEMDHWDDPEYASCRYNLISSKIKHSFENSIPTSGKIEMTVNNMSDMKGEMKLWAGYSRSNESDFVSASMKDNNQVVPNLKLSGSVNFNPNRVGSSFWLQVSQFWYDV